MTVMGTGCAHDELGTGVWVHALRIEGNRAFSDGAITDKLATQTTGWWPLASKKWFDSAAFDLDLKRVDAFYADHGYFDARVVDHQVKKVDGKPDAVDILIKVQENSPTNIGAVRIQSLPPPEEARARKAAASWDVKAGKRFDYSSYSGLEGTLGDRLKDDGYAYGAVTGSVSVDRDRHVADVQYDGKPGPRVRMGKTTIEGNDRIPAWKLYRRIGWNEGDVYSPSELAAAQGRLYNLGVFSSVRVDLPPQPTDVADVVVHVKPGPLREMRLGAGIGADRAQEQVHLRGEWTFSNFLGGLRKLRLRFMPAYVVIPSVTNVQRAGFAGATDIQLTQPDVFATNVVMHVLGGFDLGVSEGYQYYGPRAELGGERPFLRNRLLLGASWNLQYLDFFNVNQDVFGGASDRFFGFKDPYRLAYVEAFGQLDLRDRALQPRYGGYLSLRAEVGDPALGGDFHYVKFTPEARAYVPLGRRMVLAGRALTGWISTYDSDGSPITRRFRLGGPADHRGFGFGRLSPQARDQQGRLIPYGGDGQVLLSGELRVDVMKIGGNWLGLIPFVDAGDVTPTFAELKLGQLHVAPGLDGAYNTPIGVARAGVAVRLNRVGPGNPDPGERFAFHFTIGEAF
ncbi:MAG TPA: POTRA domain-containing protein [Polyangia bacterium]|nr:POTRA domain-containing protein [Polyangia bacterium]